MDNDTYKILMIEDDEIDQLVFKRFIDKEHLPYNCTMVDSVASAKKVLDSDEFDIIISDYLLGDGTGLDVLFFNKDIPVIMITGAGDEEIAVKAIKAGAWDYLVKDSSRNYLKLLPIIIELVVENKKNKDDVKKFEMLKNEFAMTLSHELKTPLSVIKAIISNIMENEFGEISSELRYELDIANQNVDRLTRMITNFIEISKTNFNQLKLNKSTFGVKPLITEVVASLKPIAARKKMELTYFMPEKEISITADRDKLIEVFTNLIENATKYGSQNGMILLFADEDNEFINFKVSDNGPGIDKMHLKNIFNRFIQIEKAIQSEDKTSIGLGLPLVKDIIEHHNGNIWVESEPGKGCTFGIRLPKFNSEQHDISKKEKFLDWSIH